MMTDGSLCRFYINLLKSDPKYWLGFLVFAFVFILQGAPIISQAMERQSKSKFTIIIAVEGLESFGIDTPISLVATERKIAFREVTDQRLKRILLEDDPVSLAAVKMVLEKGHLERKEFARDNAQISSRFLASLLDIATPKTMAKEMMERLFRKDLLGGIDMIMKAALSGKGIPRPADIASMWESDDVVKIYPFLLDLKGPELSRHRKLTEVAVEFLKQKVKLVQVEGMDWVEGFICFAEVNGFW